VNRNDSRCSCLEVIHSCFSDSGFVEYLINNLEMVNNSVKGLGKFNAYIDGFNLYKGALEKRPDLKWLDLIGLCGDLMPNYELGAIYYFTAPLKNRFAGDRANEKQNTYLRVLRYSGVQVINGKFRNDTSWQRLVTSERTHFIQPVLPNKFGLTQMAINKSWRDAKPDVPKANIFTLKEKGSDVNLASHLLRDAYTEKVCAGLVITGDSDLSSAISFACETGREDLIYSWPFHSLRARTLLAC